MEKEYMRMSWIEVNILKCCDLKVEEGSQTMQFLLAHYIISCPNVRIECPFACGISPPRRDYPSHFNECDNF